MQFDLMAVDAKDPHMVKFRERWKELTKIENGNLDPGNPNHLSPAQELTIDLFTGNDAPYQDVGAEDVIVGFKVPQLELESLFRGRNQVLAEMIQGEMNRGQGE